MFMRVGTSCAYKSKGECMLGGIVISVFKTVLTLHLRTDDQDLT